MTQLHSIYIILILFRASLTFYRGAIQNFEEQEGPLFDDIINEVTKAREYARISELKSKEAALEAAEWISERKDVKTELAFAKACIDKADAILVSV